MGKENIMKKNYQAPELLISYAASEDIMTSGEDVLIDTGSLWEETV